MFFFLPFSLHGLLCFFVLDVTSSKRPLNAFFIILLNFFLKKHKKHPISFFLRQTPVLFHLVSMK